MYLSPSRIDTSFSKRRNSSLPAVSGWLPISKLANRVSIQAAISSSVGVRRIDVRALPPMETSLERRTSLCGRRMNPARTVPTRPERGSQRSDILQRLLFSSGQTTSSASFGRSRREIYRPFSNSHFQNMRRVCSSACASLALSRNSAIVNFRILHFLRLKRACATRPASRIGGNCNPGILDGSDALE